MNIVSIACLVGFLGDMWLQFSSRYLHLGGKTGWGLKGYFAQHGSVESTFIAGGMMSLFYALYELLPLPMNYTYLAIYGILLDLLFRKTMLFTSLKGYYEYFNYFWSAVWGAIPMVIPLFILRGVPLIFTLF